MRRTFLCAKLSHAPLPTLLVCVVDSRSVASGHDEFWCYVDSDSVADSKICFVESRGVADLLVCFVDSRSAAGWNADHELKDRIA